MLLDNSAEFFMLGISTFASFCAGLGIAGTYIKANDESEYAKSFAFTLAILTVIMSSVSMIIGTNIAVSIGLFGILSILRFRASIRNIKDMSYLLVAIAIGLAAGAKNWILMTLMSICFIALIAIFSKLKIYGAKLKEFIFIINGNTQLDVQVIFEKFEFCGAEPILRSHSTSLESKLQEFTISSGNIKANQLKEIIDAIKSLHGVTSLSVISPYSTPSE